MSDRDKKIAVAIALIVVIGYIFKYLINENLDKQNTVSIKYSVGYIKGGTYWTNNIEVLPELKKAFKSDKTKLQQLISENKIYYVNKNIFVELYNLSDDNLKIIFKEGKDTDKVGYTIKSFTTYNEISNEQVKHEMVQKAMLVALVKETDDYDIAIQEGNLDKVKEIKKEYEEYLRLIKQGYESKNIFDTKEEVIKIFNYRIWTLENYINHVRCYQKRLVNSAENYKNLMYENWQKAEDLRREFESEYGIEYVKKNVDNQMAVNNSDSEKKMFQMELDILLEKGQFPEGLEITIPKNTSLILGGELSSNLIKLNENTKAIVEPRAKLKSKNKLENLVRFLEGEYAGQLAILFKTDYILNAKLKK